MYQIFIISCTIIFISFCYIFLPFWYGVDVFGFWYIIKIYESVFISLLICAKSCISPLLQLIFFE